MDSSEVESSAASSVTAPSLGIDLPVRMDHCEKVRQWNIDTAPTGTACDPDDHLDASTLNSSGGALGGSSVTGSAGRRTLGQGTPKRPDRATRLSNVTAAVMKGSPGASDSPRMKKPRKPTVAASSPAHHQSPLRESKKTVTTPRSKTVSESVPISENGTAHGPEDMDATDANSQTGKDSTESKENNVPMRQKVRSPAHGSKAENSPAADYRKTHTGTPSDSSTKGRQKVRRVQTFTEKSTRTPTKPDNASEQSFARVGSFRSAARGSRPTSGGGSVFDRLYGKTRPRSSMVQVQEETSPPPAVASTPSSEKITVEGSTTSGDKNESHRDEPNQMDTSHPDETPANGHVDTASKKKKVPTATLR